MITASIHLPHNTPNIIQAHTTSVPDEPGLLERGHEALLDYLHPVLEGQLQRTVMAQRRIRVVLLGDGNLDEGVLVFGEERVEDIVDVCVGQEHEDVPEDEQISALRHLLHPADGLHARIDRQGPLGELLGQVVADVVLALEVDDPDEIPLPEADLCDGLHVRVVDCALQPDQEVHVVALRVADALRPLPALPQLLQPLHGVAHRRSQQTDHYQHPHKNYY